MYTQLSWTNPWRLSTNSSVISRLGTSFESLWVCRKSGNTSGLCPVAKGTVTVDEMKDSEQEVVKAVQKKYFPEEGMQLAEVNQADGATAKSVSKLSSI